MSNAITCVLRRTYMSDLGESLWQTLWRFTSQNTLDLKLSKTSCVQAITRRCCTLIGFYNAMTEHVPSRRLSPSDASEMRQSASSFRKTALIQVIQFSPITFLATSRNVRSHFQDTDQVLIGHSNYGSRMSSKTKDSRISYPVAPNSMPPAYCVH